MEANVWLYIMILLIYALGLLYYLADFLMRRVSAKWTGTGLFALVWILQAIYFLARMFRQQYVPVMTIFEALFFLGWSLVTAALVLYLLLRLDSVVLLLGSLGFVALLIGFFADSATIDVVHLLDLDNVIMLSHMSLGLVSYAAFTSSAVFSGLYFFLHWKLKEKRWSHRLRHLPSLDAAETYAFRATVVGCGFLLVSLSLGAFRVWMMGELQLLLDLKVLTSILLFGMYSLYAMLKLSRLASGERLALWNLTAYAIMLFNFSISNVVSEFHHWT